MAWVWVVWCLTHSLLYSPPLEVCQSVDSTPTASVRMSGGQELIHASRIISDTELPLDCECAVAEYLAMQTIVSCTRQGRFRGPFEHSESGTSDLLLPLRFQPGQSGLGRMYEGELLPRVLRRLMGE